MFDLILYWILIGLVGWLIECYRTDNFRSIGGLFYWKIFGTMLIMGPIGTAINIVLIIQASRTKRINNR